MMERRFFVTIVAPNRSAFAALQRLNLDLFGVTARPEGESSSGGLVTETDINQLRNVGCEVKIIEEYIAQEKQKGRKTKPPVPIMDDKAWLKEFYRRKEQQ